MKKLFLFFLLLLSFAPELRASSQRLFNDRESDLLDIFNNAELTIRREGNYSRALDLYLAFIREAEGDERLEPQLLTAYISVAVIYGSFNDTDNAIIYNKLAYPLAKKLGDRKFAELALTNLAQSYKEKHAFAAADKTADRLLAEYGRLSRTASFHYSIIKGETAHLRKRHAEALRHFRDAYYFECRGFLATFAGENANEE